MTFARTMAGLVMFLGLTIATTSGVTVTCKDGWSSATGTCGASTPAQKAIVTRAIGAVGGPSGLSQECTLTAGCWLTDADPNSGAPDISATNPNNDGYKMKQALHLFYLWQIAGSKKPYILSKLQSFMANQLTGYATINRQAMATHMTSIPASIGIDPAKWTANQTLAFVGIQKQCLEWVITTVLAASTSSNPTKAKNYNPPSGVVPVSAAVRPGMGLYHKGDHAMLITDIQWKNNLPVLFKVAEANFGSGWLQDPAGEIPWMRFVDLRSTQTVPAANDQSYIVVDFEK